MAEKAPKIKVPKVKKQKVKGHKSEKEQKIKYKRAKIGKSLSFKLEAAVAILLAFFFMVLIITLNISISSDSIKSYSELSSSIINRRWRWWTSIMWTGAFRTHGHIPTVISSWMQCR